MITNFRLLIKSIPNWRHIYLLIMALVLTVLTFFLCSEFITYLFLSSITVREMQYALAEILGYSNYYDVLEFLGIQKKILYLLVALFYLIVLYRSEMKKQFLKHLEKIIKETSILAEGNFEYQIQNQSYTSLNLLVNNINKIVLQLKESMEEERHIEHTKNELVTNVSHDLRTPLTSILGYLRIIEQDQYRDEVELRHFTGIAFEKALSLERLINELFEYTRMQDSRITLSKVPINLTEMIGQTIIQNQIHFDENNMICREKFFTRNAFVLGDGDKLVRVFDNLIMNAIKYGQDGKYIDIEVVEVGDSIVVKVSNYGNPISSLDLPHIFERFYRAEKSRATSTGGAGLGLAITKSIITLHGGKIEVVSNYEKTTFIVTIPKMDGNLLNNK